MSGKIRRKVNNKLKGAFGQTTYHEHGATIEINKKRHKNKRALKEFPKKDRSMLNTIVHEELHANHPRMTEKVVRKKARKSVSRMGRSRKNKLYNKYRYA